MSDLIQLKGVELSKTGATFEDSGISKEQWTDGLKALSKCDSALQWWIGDFLVYGENTGFSNSHAEDVQELFGKKSSTLLNYQMVSSSVDSSVRTENLSWQHHLHVAPLPKRQQKAWLNKAEKEGLSASKLKDEIRKKNLTEAAEENPLPEGQYRVIYSDPPWFYNDQRLGTVEGGGATAHYPTMKTEELCELPVAEMRGTESALFLWATAPCLPDAMQVIDAWGFEYKAQFVWDKVRGFNGHYNDVCHELLLIATRGQCVPQCETLRKSIVSREKDRHSKKPELFYEIIEELYPGPYVEMFARETREGWDSWGNEV